MQSQNVYVLFFKIICLGSKNIQIGKYMDFIS